MIIEFGKLKSSRFHYWKGKTNTSKRNLIEIKIGYWVICICPGLNFRYKQK